ncbi:MAG: response regulator [Deltaproteobacteria bacterium]|nr:response regulator [Deltaproteobacteria bacterium]
MAKILVIDDENIGRAIIKNILEKAGHEVQEANNGKTGAELYHQDPADIIITDIFMPEQDGIQTILRLKKEFPLIKIIAISGGGSMLQSSEYLQHAQDFGALKTFKKPVDPKELVDTINEILK